MSKTYGDNSKVGTPSTKGKKGKRRCRSGINSRTIMAKPGSSLIIALHYTGNSEGSNAKREMRRVQNILHARHIFTQTPTNEDSNLEPIAFFHFPLKNENGRMDIVNRITDKARELGLKIDIAHNQGGRVFWTGKKTGSIKPGSIVRELFKQTETAQKWLQLLVSMYGSHSFVCPVKQETVEQWYLRTYTATIPHDWMNRVSFHNRISLEYNIYYDIVNIHARYCQDMVFNANTALVQRKDDIGKQFARIEREEWTRRLTLIHAWIAKGIRKEEITKTRTLLRETAKTLFARMDILKKRTPKNVYVRTKVPFFADRVYSRKMYRIFRNYLDMPKKELFGQSDYTEQMNTISTLTSNLVCHKWNCPVSAKELSEHTSSDAVFASKHFDDTHIIHGLSNEDNIGKSINPIGYNKSMPEWEAKQTIVAIGYNRICPFPIMDSWAMGI